MKKKEKRESLWKHLNTPLWTPLGLMGWTAWWLSILNPKGLEHWILVGIWVFAMTAWLIRDFRERIKDKP